MRNATTPVRQPTTDLSARYEANERKLDALEQQVAELNGRLAALAERGEAIIARLAAEPATS